MVKINFSRLKNDLLELAKIGKVNGAGLHRMAFSEADMEAREWLKRKIQVAGLNLHEDGASNIWGRLYREDSKPSVIMGSHIDTVPGGGPLDGALGVLTALECLRRYNEEGISSQYPLEMVSFSDEEGRFGGLFGSEAVCGVLTTERVQNARDVNGIPLMETMEKWGRSAMDAFKAKRNPAGIHSYLELHIEQGPVLESLGVPVGIVENISGMRHWVVKFLGKANHAGTTPMPMRNDAFQGLVALAYQIPELLSTEGTERSVATIGRAELFPGVMNVIPAMVKFTLDIRDTNHEKLKGLANAIQNAISRVARERGLNFELEIVSETTPAVCHPFVLDAVEETIKELNLPVHRMSSGSVHDALMMSRIAPTGMIFVPSKGGKSHSPEEWTDWEHIEMGANVALNSLIRIAGE